MADAGPTTATGSPVLEGAESPLRSYNKTYGVLDVVSDSVFTVAESSTTLLDPLGTIEARAKPRIAQAVDVDRAQDLFTEQATAKPWLFVSLDNSIVSKSREVGSDASHNIRHGEHFRQQVIQEFSVFLIVPVTDSLSGEVGRDVAEDMFLPLCQSVLGSVFSSGLSATNQNLTQFETHGAQLYTTAIYVHAYTFSHIIDLLFEDTVGADVDVAFRDIHFELFPEVGNSTRVTHLDGDVDLDEDQFS